MKLALALTAAASAALMALPAQAAAPPADYSTCIYTRDLRNHTVGDDHTLYFDVAGRGVYRIEMSNNCLATAVSSDPLVMRSVTGSPQICKPLDIDIQVNHSRCLIQGMSKLTPAEVTALPRRVKP